MTAGGWLFMILAWAFIIVLCAFCFYRTLKQEGQPGGRDE